MAAQQRWYESEQETFLKRRSFLTTTLAGIGGLAYGAELDWPGAGVREAGFDPDKLNALRDDLARRTTTGFLVIRGGRKVMEWYSPDFGPTKPHYTASLAKALVGGTSLIVAMSDGRIRPNDRVSKYIPSWEKDPKKSRITIRQLATHTSGIEDSSVEGYAHGKEPAWKGQFWRREPDPFSVSIIDAPVIFEPGTSFEYSNPGMAILAYCVTASLKGAPQTDIHTLLRDRVLRPIGVPDADWSIGYGKPTQMDGLDVYANWGGASFTPRAVARVGEWMMKSGAWDGKALVRPAVIQQAANYTGMPIPPRTPEDSNRPGSGLCWYTNFDMAWPAVPRDAFAGSGAQQQVLLVVPSLDLVVVRNGSDLSEDAKQHSAAATYRHLYEPLMAAMGYPAQPKPSPYPKSKVIRGVSFGAEVTRKALDSDNWPVTWADDGAIYTSYGDGHGFEPFVEEKLSMGFAKVEGSGTDWRGTNIRSSTGETKGEGKAGPKASGMLMVDGVLYAWVRNTGNAQLIWSADHARTWQWGFKIDKSFGSPCFLNFGRNYAGARDEYVYTYSQAGPSAYELDNAIVLARVSRKRIRERAAWEFFAGYADDPHWTRDIGNASPVFSYRGHCQRTDAVYHPVLKRCLLAVGYGHNGGWGIYDAPAPWGPWSVAFHTEYWGLGGTHGYRLPAKWISGDGHTMQLVFSGVQYNGVLYDAFCVREMKLDF
jgi:CubicO group peptidase (beta-lactamase class C family)